MEASVNLDVLYDELNSIMNDIEVFVANKEIDKFQLDVKDEALYQNLKKLVAGYKFKEAMEIMEDLYGNN